MSTLKVAFVGVAVHSGTLDPDNPRPGILHTFKAMKAVEVVAYCIDPDASWATPDDSERLRVLREVERGARFYTKVDDLIAQEDFDLAVMLLPPCDIPAVGIKLAKAGKHMFCEKQFARTAADLLPLVRAVRENNVQFFATYPWRRHPVAVELRRLIEAGALGRLTALEVRQVTSQVSETGGRSPKHWSYRMETEGGGILHMLGCHYLELTRALMGCEVKTVSAICRSPVGETEDGVEDAAMLAMEWENGAVATMHAGYLAAPGSPADNCIIVRGTHGTAVWNVGQTPGVLKVFSSKWSSTPERTFEFELKKRPLVYGESQWILELYESGVDAMRANADPPVTVQDALRVLEVIDAAYESSRTGRRAEVKRHA